jgi:serine/threonine protein kinase
MLTRDGEVKLVDFGIAVALGTSPDPADGGLPTGSFPYMSPEQARGDALTAQTDLFSLGVNLWEMLTGQRLFARASADETVAAVAARRDARPASRVRPELPERGSRRSSCERLGARAGRAASPTPASSRPRCTRYLAEDRPMRRRPRAGDPVARPPRRCPTSPPSDRAPATATTQVDRGR